MGPNFTLLWAVFFTLSSWSALADSLLITTFDPFAGRAENRTQAVGRLLQNKLKSNQIQVTLCNLPVVYDKGAETALKCYEKMSSKPGIVLSLGEGSCETRIETRAFNLDDTPTLADNAGNLRKSQTILKSGPKYLALNIPAQAMYCSLHADQLDHVRVSNSLDQFVCNNVAYHLAVGFQDLSVQYGFVHIPPSSCGKISDPELQADKIVQMIRGLVAFKNTTVLSNYPLPHFSNRKRLPISKIELKNSQFELKNSKNTRCELEFIRKLENSYTAPVPIK